MLIKSDEWQPSKGIRIDDRTLEMVKSNVSMSILAGPGAGKTEVLAQRANFLLTTGLCPSPQRILAIAFKADAARNLGDRVAERCDSIQAKRFESLTLDAFAKRILDQFLEALPEHLRPSPNYRIIVPSNDIWDNLRQKHVSLQGKQNRELNSIVHQIIKRETCENVIWSIWWRQQIQFSPSCLTFDMIKNLATYILQSLPVVQSALRQTYSHVFLDEFQDVTGLQYELIKVAFHGSEAVITAVGDTKQAIMGWAGALPEIFSQFEGDFGAEMLPLRSNFRSNARIVVLINSLAENLYGDVDKVECARKDDAIPEDAVEGWIFDKRKDESDFLASFIAQEFENTPTLKPSDFVILTKIKADNLEKRLGGAFQKCDLLIRNEARTVGGIAIQDLVCDRVYSFFLASLKLAVNVRGGQPFQDCKTTIADVQGADLDSERGYSKALAKVRELTDDIKKLVSEKQPLEVSGNEVTVCILKHVSEDELRKTYREYGEGDRIKTIIEAFGTFFDECRKDKSDWQDCISEIEGHNSVRLMTIHKSKGLEYHTVFFVEFNDDSFWQKKDDDNVFFVALSRARERVYFSHTEDSKGLSNVKEFVKALKEAGVGFKGPLSNE